MGYIKTTGDERMLIFQGVDAADLPIIRSAATKVDAEIIPSRKYEATG